MSMLFTAALIPLSTAQETQTDMEVLREGQALATELSESGWSRLGRSESAVSWLTELLLREAEQQLTLETWAALGPDTLRTDARSLAVTRLSDLENGESWDQLLRLSASGVLSRKWITELLALPLSPSDSSLPDCEADSGLEPEEAECAPLRPASTQFRFGEPGRLGLKEVRVLQDLGSTGHQNGHLEPGEWGLLSVSLSNEDELPWTSSTGALRSGSDCVFTTDSMSSQALDEMMPGEGGALEAWIYVAEQCEIAAGAALPLTLEIYDSKRSASEPETLSLILNRPTAPGPWSKLRFSADLLDSQRTGTLEERRLEQLPPDATLEISATATGVPSGIASAELRMVWSEDLQGLLDSVEESDVRAYLTEGGGLEGDDLDFSTRASFDELTGRAARGEAWFAADLSLQDGQGRAHAVRRHFLYPLDEEAVRRANSLTRRLLRLAQDDREEEEISDEVPAEESLTEEQVAEEEVEEEESAEEGETPEETETAEESESSEEVQPTVKVVPGCIDRAATNYNRKANEDDGSCEFELALFYFYTGMTWAKFPHFQVGYLSRHERIDILKFSIEAWIPQTNEGLTGGTASVGVELFTRQDHLGLNLLMGGGYMKNHRQDREDLVVHPRAHITYELLERLGVYAEIERLEGVQALSDKRLESYQGFGLGAHLRW